MRQYQGETAAKIKLRGHEDLEESDDNKDKKKGVDFR